MIRSARTGACYCGKCGKKLLDDSYNTGKHAELCGYAAGSYEPLKEGVDLGYRLEGSREGVLLSVCRPLLKLIRGFTDRFYGAEWESVFEVKFPAGSKVPAVLKNETGLEPNILMRLIKAGRILPISPEKDAEEVHKAFPAVIDLHSIQMFAHIYRNKGFGTERILPEETERKLLRKIPEDCVWDDGSCRPEKNKIFANICRYRGEHYILHLVFQYEGEPVVLLFSKNYCACSKRVSVRELLKREYCLAGKAKAAVRRFDEIYPEYHLAQYAELSQNILFPLLAADYHSGIELAARACAPSIAENYELLSEMKKDPALYKNLKKMFGLPIQVLRTLTREQASDAVLERMKQINAYNPVFLQFEEYTPSMIEFYMRAAIDRGHIRNGVDGIDNLTDRQILQILRFLKNHPNEGHYYCDYLSACARLGEYLYGLTPDIPIREAHDRTVERIEINRDRLMQLQFGQAVTSWDYKRLATCFTEEDEERFEGDPFIVTVPAQIEDLFAESENMHNCVRLYVSRVASKNARIYFLRKKEEPEKSYGTLEVSHDGVKLCQAKAFANERLPMYAQRFVVKWCRVKRIKIGTYDISNQAQSASA